MRSPSSSTATTASSVAAGASDGTSRARSAGSTGGRSRSELVADGEAHAALVLDGDGVAQGWAQYGSPEELPGIKHRREYDKDAPPWPDWRITCVFVDKGHRGQGVARAAVEGAVAQIGAAGGGLVEAISEATDGRVAHGRFLFSATAELFDSLGFERVRQVGKHAWVVGRRVAATG